MPRPSATDPLFAAIHALRGTPPEPGEPRLRGFLRQAQERQLPWHEAYAQAVLAIRLCDVSHVDAAALAEAALASFEAQGCAWGRCTALSALAGARSHAGQPHAALELHQATVPLARETGDTAILALCLKNLAVALRLVGQCAVALDLAEEAHGLVRDNGTAIRSAVALTLADVLLELARRARCAGAPPAQWEGLAGRAAEVMRALVRSELPGAEELRTADSNWLNLAAAQVLLEQHEPARRILALLLPHYAAAGDRSGQMFVQRQLGWSHLQRGEWEQALACTAAHHELVQATGLAAEEHRGLEIEALALEQAGRWQQALAAFRRYHASHARHVLEQAAEKARSLAVAMQTDRALRESQLDALTDLANRRAFDTAVARAVG
ncbi:MAG: tetratricopeptide repeat protein, partial [Rubrivivax sp.]